MITLPMETAGKALNLLEILESRSFALEDRDKASIQSQAASLCGILRSKLETGPCGSDPSGTRIVALEQRIEKLEVALEKVLAPQPSLRLLQCCRRIEKLEASQAEVAANIAEYHATHLGQLERGLQATSRAGVHGRNELSQQIFSLREKVLAMGTLLQSRSSARGSDAG